MVSPDHYLPSRPLSREMEMPAMRSLAGDGATFTNAFCTVPICAPSRASMYTGRYPYVMANPGGGHASVEKALRREDVIFPEYLKAAGYVTRHVGKNHVGAQKFMDAFDELDSNWDRAMPAVEQDSGYRAHLRRMGVKLPRYKREIQRFEPDRKTPGRALGGWIEQADGKPFPLEGQYTHYLAAWAVQKLDDALAVAGKGPVYLQLNIYDPHQPFTIPAGMEAREAQLRKAVSLPPSYRETVARDFRPAPGEPALLDFHRRVWGMYRPEFAADYMVANALAMEVIDLAVAEFLKAVKQRGLYDDSLIIFTADHGEMNCHHALVDKGAYLHPETQRVPLVVKFPARFGVRGRTVEAPVSLLDIAPAVCEAAGIEVPERQDGRSLFEHVTGAGRPADRELMFQAGWLATGNPACGTQRWEPGGRHHFFVYNLASTSDELYDLADPDPGNVASRPEHASALAEMTERMFALIQRDPRWSCYANGFRLPHYAQLARRGRRTG
jgi:arylsulfatase A-like enzyme